ncbi:DNA polymerase [Granulicella rosea]|uniref:Type-4 uracil-DNA glycosylase n=1 Tax=Granulicella rosea TaxID=474952 RepID=A0A239HVM2_9BACT|nr:UdgX family uracil-DNA binding protein [Granulicella rosea]SNS84224.1 DNA polymerase [Granulicella rosea]
MHRVPLQSDFEAWRAAARDALHAGFRPEELDLQDATVPSTLALTLDTDDVATGAPIVRPHTSKAFLETAAIVAVHRSPDRWNLLYRVLYRLQSERNLLQIETDDDVSQLVRLEAQVRRDLHKMHAFVRFRKVMEASDPSERPVVVDEPIPIDPDPHAHHLVLVTPTPFGEVKTEIEACPPPVSIPDKDCEHFVAWYEPDHRILPLAAPFFAERFAIMRWSILTPEASVSWDPIAKKLIFGPGVPRESAPAEDELEDLWRTYYASIFNPARLNQEAMRSEMPVRYWKNLPEVALLPALIGGAQTRVAAMVKRQQQQPTAEPFLPAQRSLPALRDALPSCKGCELYCHATQVVPGVGASNSPLMLVGEQPGDQEDVQGLPFVGPAGKLLHKALAELNIDPASIYMTNAVKHFKFIRRGKIRLHQSPRMSEITACKPWLLAEIEALRPRVILCLGATASKSLLGGTFALMRDRGKILATPHAERVLATVHPSAVLRGRDQQSIEQLYQFLKDDLALAWKSAQATASPASFLVSPAQSSYSR